MKLARSNTGLELTTPGEARQDTGIMTELSLAPNASTLLIGIDDTDNIASRGTGFLAQHLLAVLEEEGLGVPLGATRHQLLVDPRVPYTSHNSSACLSWDGGRQPAVSAIVARCAAILEAESAPGSDPGLAVATGPSWSDPDTRRLLVDFGCRAKLEVLDQPLAWSVAQAAGLHLSGHGGDGGGVIGALAGIGLHLSGADGFFLWMPGIRSLEGQATYAQLRSSLPIDSARDLHGREPEPDDLIELGDWVRPVWRDGRAVLLLEPHTAGWTTGTQVAPWRVASREVVKRH